MFPFLRRSILLAAVLVAGAGYADPAHAFRCKNKLVKEGMHEQQVIAVCGEPTSERHLGYAIRSVPYGWRRVGPGGSILYPRGGALTEEVIVTEWIYNFGPRKLMRRLVFQGGVLVEIDTIGYGYIEKDSDAAE